MFRSIMLFGLFLCGFLCAMLAFAGLQYETVGYGLHPGLAGAGCVLSAWLGSAFAKQSLHRS